ncbi:hypothetical protein GCM10017673_38330 [Streptosporangium violaceochromogenes]|nr:hypothetical protein GCM10017673_38330 [Streptosporangium violaceochromogenes]
MWVAALGVLAAKAGIDLPLHETTVVVLAVAISGYYLVGRLLEKVPGLAWVGRVLLSAGVAGEPSYGGGRGVGEGRQVRPPGFPGV